MELHLTAEQEAQLARLAAKSGTDAEHLAQDAVLRLLEQKDSIRDAPPQFPVLHLGAMKSLRRGEIYDDVP